MTRPSWRSSFLRDPGAKFLGGKLNKQKNSLNFASTCLKVVDTRRSEGKRVAMVLTNAVGGRAVGKTGEVVFECYTDLCFLSQLWTPGQDTGRELLRSRSETEIAKRETGKYFALLGAALRK